MQDKQKPLTSLDVHQHSTNGGKQGANIDPTSHNEKVGPKTGGIDHLVDFSTHKKDGESGQGDGKKHWSGH